MSVDYWALITKQGEVHNPARSNDNPNHNTNPGNCYNAFPMAPSKLQSSPLKSQAVRVSTEAEAAFTPDPARRAEPCGTASPQYRAAPRGNASGVNAT